MINIAVDKIEDWYLLGKEKSLKGRYITFTDIEPLLKEHNAERIGKSVLGKSIYKYVLGSGVTKVFIWTQMHGNESTGTKAMFDLLKFFKKPVGFERLATQILENCTLLFLPMLNPDGAEVYTRVNANKLDLNRDAVEKSQPESELLRKVLDDFKPDYCFNMHDQRTIFTVGDTKETATLSFLAPSINKEREITEDRKETMRVIVAINELMQKIIPNKIGRYTDEFYPTATGDNFQKLGYNTILVESGHYKDDYQREISRKFTFYSLLQGLNYISRKEERDFNDYFSIPNNTKFYLDIIVRNIYYEGGSKGVDIGVLFKEELVENDIFFRSEIEVIGDLSHYISDRILEGNQLKFNNKAEFLAFIEKK